MILDPAYAVKSAYHLLKSCGHRPSVRLIAAQIALANGGHSIRWSVIRENLAVLLGNTLTRPGQQRATAGTNGQQPGNTSKRRGQQPGSKWPASRARVVILRRDIEKEGVVKQPDETTKGSPEAERGFASLAAVVSRLRPPETRR